MNISSRLGRAAAASPGGDGYAVAAARPSQIRSDTVSTLSSVSTALLDKLAIVRRRVVAVETLDGSCLIILSLIGGLFVTMLLDDCLELPLVIRAILLACVVGWLGFLFAKRVGARWWRMPDDDELALQVQRQTPTLGSRLIAAVQLARAAPAGASVALIQAHIEETERLAAPLDFRSAVSLHRVKRLSLGTAAAVVIALMSLLASGADGRDLLLRALLVPGIDVPRRTHVRLLTPDPTVIGKGESVTLRARAIGVVPSDGVVTLQYEGQSDPVQIRLDAVADRPGEFAATVSAVTQSFSYQIHLNDGQSEEAHVRASVRPAIASLDIQQYFPPYTHLGPEKRMPNDLQLLAGSRLSLHATASSAIHAAGGDIHLQSRVIFHCKSGDVERALTPAGVYGWELVTNSPVDVPGDAQGLSVIAVDRDGLASADPVVYPITILADQPPTVSVTYPLKKEQLSTAIARLIVGVDARDDFALGNVRLCYRILRADQPPEDVNAATSTDKSGGAIDLKLDGTPRQLRGRFPFELSILQPRPALGDSIEWWLEANDTNDVTGPGKAASEHYLTRIATEADVRADLYSQLADQMADLKKTADTQKKDNADLGALIQQVKEP